MTWMQRGVIYGPEGSPCLMYAQLVHTSPFSGCQYSLTVNVNTGRAAQQRINKQKLPLGYNICFYTSTAYLSDLFHATLCHAT